MRGAKVGVTCPCGEKFMARVADRKRGWGKFCSKSCKAKVQEKRTGQCAEYHRRQRAKDEFFNDDDNSWDGIYGTYEGR